jgi:hypothetical protein
MEFCKQKTSFRVQPQESLEQQRRQQGRHGVLLPNSIRAIICGPSNSGKTHLMVSLLFHRNGVRFQNCHIYCKTLHQPKYRFVERVLRDMKGVTLEMFDRGEKVLPPEAIPADSVVIFDDVSCENQNIVRDYFARGRHYGMDAFYLCQSYARVPKHLIRDNVNLVMLFRQDDLNLQHIYNDHVRNDMSLDTFRQMCKSVWSKDKYGYVVIDLESDVSNGRYRRGLDEYWQCPKETE